MIVWAGVNGMIASGVIYLSQYKGANDSNHMQQSYRFMLVSSYLFCMISSYNAFLYWSIIIRLTVYKCKKN